MEARCGAITCTKLVKEATDTVAQVAAIEEVCQACQFCCFVAAGNDANSKFSSQKISLLQCNQSLPLHIGVQTYINSCLNTYACLSSVLSGTLLACAAMR